MKQCADEDEGDQDRLVRERRRQGDETGGQRAIEGVGGDGAAEGKAERAAQHQRARECGQQVELDLDGERPAHPVDAAAAEQGVEQQPVDGVVDRTEWRVEVPVAAARVNDRVFERQGGPERRQDTGGPGGQEARGRGRLERERDDEAADEEEQADAGRGPIHTAHGGTGDVSGGAAMTQPTPARIMCRTTV